MGDTDDVIADHASNKEISLQESVQSRKEACMAGCNLLRKKANIVMDMESPRGKTKRGKKRRNRNVNACSDSQGDAILKESNVAESADLPNELEAAKDVKVVQNSCDSIPEPQDRLNSSTSQEKGKRKKKRHLETEKPLQNVQSTTSFIQDSSVVGSLDLAADGTTTSDQEKGNMEKNRYLGTQKSPTNNQCTTFVIEDRFVDEYLDLVIDGSTMLGHYQPDPISGVPASNEEKCCSELSCPDTENKKKENIKRKRKKNKGTEEDPNAFQGDAASIRTGSAEGTGYELGAVSDMRTDQHPSLNDASYVEEGSVNELPVDIIMTEDHDASQLDSFKMDHNKSVPVNKTFSMGDTSSIENHACISNSGLVGSEDKCTDIYKRREGISLPCQKPPELLEAIAEPSLMMTGEPAFDHSSDMHSSACVESKLDNNQVGNFALTRDDKGILDEKMASGFSNNDFVPSEEKAPGIKKGVDVEVKKKIAVPNSSEAPEKTCEYQVIKSRCAEEDLGNTPRVGKITMNNHNLPDSGSTKNRSRILDLGIKNPHINTSLTSDHNYDGNDGHVPVRSSAIKTCERQKSRSESSNSREVTVKASMRSSSEIKSSDRSESKPHNSEAGNDINRVEVHASISAEKIIPDCSHTNLATKERKEAMEMVNVVGRSVRGEKPPAFHPNKKLLVLDINGLLADIVHDLPGRYRCNLIVSNKSVFRRPFCSDFLYFCFEKFNVGVWSSRAKKNMDKIIPFIFRSYEPKLLFCWNAFHCTKTGFNTVEKSGKPLMLKELRNLWENRYNDLPWNKGVFNETNTLLLDDSPYKALRNPAHTAVFPSPYNFRNDYDSSLGPGGDLREYLEGLADAENVQEYVSKHPFGQKAITDSNASWGFYSKIIGEESSRPEEVASSSRVAIVESDE